MDRWAVVQEWVQARSLRQTLLEIVDTSSDEGYHESFWYRDEWNQVWIQHVLFDRHSSLRSIYRSVTRVVSGQGLGVPFLSSWDAICNIGVVEYLPNVPKVETYSWLTQDGVRDGVRKESYLKIVRRETKRFIAATMLGRTSSSWQTRQVLWTIVNSFQMVSDTKLTGKFRAR